MLELLIALHLIISALAILNCIIADQNIKKRFRRKTRKTDSEKIAGFLYGLLLCFLPIYNLIVALISKEKYMEAVKKNTDYELIESEGEVDGH